jgi:hypothetical protein
MLTIGFASNARSDRSARSACGDGARRSASIASSTLRGNSTASPARSVSAWNASSWESAT